jgi:hypothetical protein
MNLCIRFQDFQSTVVDFGYSTRWNGPTESLDESSVRGHSESLCDVIKDRVQYHLTIST